MDSRNGLGKPFPSRTPQFGVRPVRRSLAYATLIDLCVEGEGVAEATARCARIGARTEAETLVALNTGSMLAPPLRSEGTAAALRFVVECAEYIVRLTPDPRRAPRADRPVPAEGIRQVLEQEGYSVLGRKRSKDGLTHQTLAERSGVPRRTISRTCSGARNDLCAREAEAIVVLGIGRVATARYQLTVEEALDEIYELFWICRAFAGEEERLALEDRHLLYGQFDPETLRLPVGERRAARLERFRAVHGRWPHPVPDSLRRVALDALEHRHREALEQAATARSEIGPPERVTAAYARDLMRRVRKRGVIDRTHPPSRSAPTEQPGQLGRLRTARERATRRTRPSCCLHPARDGFAGRNAASNANSRNCECSATRPTSRATIRAASPMRPASTLSPKRPHAEQSFGNARSRTSTTATDRPRRPCPDDRPLRARSRSPSHAGSTFAAREQTPR
jgi:transcriptional regulator with XRE-family HTH domain